jgi:glycosyltransferase involved in cell wall biosynthesis
MRAWAARSAAALLTVSDSVRADLERLLPESRGKWRVVPNGVDPARFAPPGATAVAAARASRSLAREFVLVVASHRPHKNLAGAVRAFARVADSALPSAELVVPARDDEAAGRLAPFVAGVPRARLVTPVDDADLPALYAAARIVLLPSRIEGFGLSGLEAMACGAAVLASPIAAHREVFAEAAAFAPSASDEDLAEALASLWSDEARRASLAAAGKERAARFPWDASARAHLEAWRSVLQDS